MKINAPVQAFGDYEIRLMKEEDAPGVVELYRAIYGDHYPIKEMYDPQYIIRQQEEGLMYRVVVADASGNILGHHAMYRLKETYRGLYEGGQGMVLQEHRGKGFDGVLHGYITKILMKAIGGEEIWGESVTNHVFMQRSTLSVGGKETGIELDLMPAESYEAEKSASGRVSAVVACACLKEKPHTVFLPAPYEEVLKTIYNTAGRNRRFETAAGALPGNIETRYADTFIPSAGALRISLFEAGKDAGDVMDGLVRKYTEAGALVLQAFLPLDQSWSGALTDALNRRGFFFSALVPRWFDADALLLQKLILPTHYDNIHLYTDFAKDMLKFIIQDRKRVEGSPAL